MKIAIIGCGALGSYYGAQLCRSGQEVHFLLRSDYETVRRDGVQVLSADGNFSVRPHCARTPEEIGVCDLVIIGLKTTANAVLPTLLPLLVGPNTAVLTLQNGLGNEAQVAAIVGAEKTLGGLCFVCLNRTAPGVIQHIAHGKIVMGDYIPPSERESVTRSTSLDQTIQAFQTPSFDQPAAVHRTALRARKPQPRTLEITRVIQNSGIPCDVAENLEAAHWEKLVWNIPFNGLGVASAAGIDSILSGQLAPGQKLQPCLTTDLLLADPRWEKLVRELMMETIRAAQALGLDVPDDVANQQINRTLDMGPYKASTLIDYQRGQELELQALFLEPLAQAKRKNVPTPRLAGLCEILKELNPRS